MSAFIVSNNHINTLVRWASENGIGTWHAASSRDRQVACNEQEIAEALLLENTRSVNYRYSESEPVGAIVYTDKVMSLRPIEVIKACHCLRYQSCEHPEWATSLAHDLLVSIEQNAVTKLPGYDAAPWSIE